MLKKKKSYIRKWIIFVLILIVAASSIYLFLTTRNTSNYEEVEAKIGNIITYYSFSGNVEAKNYESVISEKLMQVSEIKVKNGDTIEAGDELIITSTGDSITAKIAGEIQGLNVDENATVMAGIKLLDIIDYDNLQISIKVDEYDLPAIDIGEETIVKINALNKEVTGTISYISKTGTTLNDVTFFIATIDLRRDSNLKIGMSAETRLLNSQANDVVILPMSVIQFYDDNTAYVLKEGENGRPEKIDILAGINDGNNVEIISGVANGEKVLYSYDTLANLLRNRGIGGR